MKTIVYLSLFLLITSCSSTKSQDSKGATNTLDTISYAVTGFNYGKELNLLSTKEFVQSEHFAYCIGGGKVEKYFGTYERTESTIILKPTRVELTISSSFMDEEEEVQKYLIDYGPDSLKISTQFKIFQWKDKEYLLSEQNSFIAGLCGKNDYQNFAYYYNTGKEPEQSGYYFTRTQDDSTANVPWNSNHLPIAYRDHFLDKPITVKVTDQIKKVETYGDHQEYEIVSWRLKINKGTKDGVRDGFRFITEDDRYFVDIDTTERDWSTGQANVHHLEMSPKLIGIEMRTRWE